jgi:hypothetical protein
MFIFVMSCSQGVTLHVVFNKKKGKKTMILNEYHVKNENKKILNSYSTFWSKFGLKHIMKLIRTNFAKSNLLIYKFKNLIQS